MNLKLEHMYGEIPSTVILTMYDSLREHRKTTFNCEHPCREFSWAGSIGDLCIFRKGQDELFKSKFYFSFLRTCLA